MSSWTDVAGWTLLHFVWQGTVIAFVTACVLRLLRGSRAQLRYAAACIALAMMLASPVATAFLLSNAPRTALSETIHVLRVDGGPIVGVAIVPPWSSAQADASGRERAAAQPPTEFRLPVPVNTNTLFSTLVTLWLAGVMILLTRLIAGCWRVRRLHLVARLEAHSRWQALAEGLAARLGLRRQFLVVDSARVSTPTVIGWLRPVVLLPIAALAGLTARQVEAILAHELAHIRRHDFLINLLQTLGETVLFYHPAVWWISSRIRIEREHCCDDVAVAVCGDAREYAAALTELASWSMAHPPLAMAATRGPLLNRVRRLLRLEESNRRFSRTTLAVAVVLTTVVGVATLGTILKAQPIVGPDGRFGPPEVNRLLGFKLFPGPAQLPTDDPIVARGWRVTVGSGPSLSLLGFSGRNVIREAYGLANTPIVGAPRWMDNEVFDLDIPGDVTVVDGLADRVQVQAAMQQYLEGRLGLTTHRETRTFPAYALVSASKDGRLGSSLKPSTIDCVASGANTRPNADPAIIEPVLHERFQMRRFCGLEDNFFGLSAAHMTMAEFTSELTRRRSPMSPDREVVDRTGLTGAYDFELRFGLLPLAAIGHAHYQFGRVLAPFGIRSVFTALPEQLGLKLVDTTVSREVLVIDQINRPD
jgi:uncharacterized protein (TIGR03435 family)